MVGIKLESAPKVGVLLALLWLWLCLNAVSGKWEKDKDKKCKAEVVAIKKTRIVPVAVPVKSKKHLIEIDLPKKVYSEPDPEVGEPHTFEDEDADGHEVHELSGHEVHGQEHEGTEGEAEGGQEMELAQHAEAVEGEVQEMGEGQEAEYMQHQEAEVGEGYEASEPSHGWKRKESKQLRVKKKARKPFFSWFKREL